MTIKIEVSTSEPWPAWARWPLPIAAAAVTAGVRAATEGLTIDLRRHVAGALTPRVANAIGARIYPEGRASLGAAGVVGARNAKADALLSAHEEGATIGPRERQALAIPTENVPRTRGAGRGGTRRMTPVEVEAAYNKELRFAPMGDLARGQTVGALILDIDLGGIKRRDIGSRGFRGGKRAERRGGRMQSVVMFILVRLVRLPKRLNAEGVARTWAERVPDLIERALPAEAS